MEEKDSYYKVELEYKDYYSCGFAGEPTELEAYGHNKLFVGDIVEVFCNSKSLGTCCVCKNLDHPYGFVVRAPSVKFKNGKFTHKFINEDEYLIIKRKSYTEMTIGDIIDGIEYKLKGKGVTTRISCDICKYGETHDYLDGYYCHNRHYRYGDFLMKTDCKYGELKDR